MGNRGWSSLFNCSLFAIKLIIIHQTIAVLRTKPTQNSSITCVIHSRRFRFRFVFVGRRFESFADKLQKEKQYAIISLFFVERRHIMTRLFKQSPNDKNWNIFFLSLFRLYVLIMGDNFDKTLELIFTLYFITLICGDLINCLKNFLPQMYDFIQKATQRAATFSKSLMRSQIFC